MSDGAQEAVVHGAIIHAAGLNRRLWSLLGNAVGAGRAAAKRRQASGYRTKRENSFAAPLVKIQEDRAQMVITTGPYSHVRHPMYFGALFFFLGIPLLLGSWWGLAFSAALTVLLCVRILNEEKTYAARVRFWLIPRIW